MEKDVHQLQLPKLPKQYQDALLLVKQVLASPKDSNNEFIAGGALRDLILKKQRVNDIDIFVFQSFDKIEMFRRINAFDLETMHGSNVYPEVDHVEFFYDSDSEESSKVIQSNRVLLNMKEGYKIDVILLLDNEWDILRTLNSFDIGFCKVAHSGQSYILHEDFISDLENKLIRVTAEGAYGPDSIRRRIEKFKAKFPDWEVNDLLLKGRKEGRITQC
jgi:hypothetical protein